RCFEAALRESLIERLVISRGHGHHRCEIGGCRAAPGNKETRSFLLLWLDESAKTLGAELVINPAILHLHGQKPVQLPANLIEEVGRSVARFGNLQRDRFESRAKMLPCLEHHAS